MIWWKTLLSIFMLRLSAIFRNTRSFILHRSLPIRSLINASRISFPRVDNFKKLYLPQLSKPKFMHNMSGITKSESAPIEYFRADYKPSSYNISEIFMTFELDESNTVVTTKSIVIPQSTSAGDLVLNGEDIELLQVSVNGKILSPDSYTIDKLALRINNDILPKDQFELETKVKLHPDTNLTLSGLYKSGSSKLLSTQCEAMGFRRITYHLDRPDILSKYTVRLQANKTKYPVLLSNGNQIETGDYDNNGEIMHYSVWEDPFPKPCYLFAVVAGDLGSIHSTYTTTSGRIVKLGIYSDKENANQLEHAMYSIKASMKWDEDTFGLECDLDIYNIVATNDFNMGAMENKGLNIFNSALALADSKTATDLDFERILGVIGHEYFHNWTGNRVTVRDWFQLTLKEGLTVFRDQWFTSDHTSKAVKRIEDVRGLRSRQFAEDSGPLSHPIRPESYISMDNFYTGTVYVKGAEVVRMYRTLLTEEGFKRGMKLYFQRFDGKAVTCDDFRQAMADANNVDLSQMERWYSQAGTPVVKVTQSYDPVAKRLTLQCTQHTPSTPNQAQEDKLPLLIPIVVGLLDRSTGKEIGESTVLRFTEEKQEFHFNNVETQPIVSILRDFSAPVKLEIIQSDEELCFLMANDTDSFNRWDAGNRYATKLILDLSKQSKDSIMNTKLPELFVNAVKTILQTSLRYEDTNNGVDPSLMAYALQLPDEATLLNQMEVIDIDALHIAHRHIKYSLASLLQSEFEQVYDLTAAKLSSEYQFIPSEVGRRRLQNTCLDYLSILGTPTTITRAKHQFDHSTCMTDKITALSCLVSHPSIEATNALESFHTDAAGSALVLNKWFMVQAIADHSHVIDTVRTLKQHSDFILSNPNRARSLIGAFTTNLYHFHAINGSGYEFLADSIIEIDKLNPQVAARMVTAFSQWKSFDNIRKGLMEIQLRRIQSQENLSKDTIENVLRCLK